MHSEAMNFKSMTCPTNQWPKVSFDYSTDEIVRAGLSEASDGKIIPSAAEIESQRKKAYSAILEYAIPAGNA